MVVMWFHEVVTQVTKSYVNYCLTGTQDVCGWFVFSSRLSQMELFINPSLKRWPLRWHCPVSSPTTTHHGWSLFNLNSSLVLLAEGPCMSAFGCFSPLKDSQCVLWSPSVQSLTAFLATPMEIPKAGSGPMNRCSDASLASKSGLLQAISSWPGTHISWILLCLVSCKRDWWQLNGFKFCPNHGLDWNWFV